VVPTSPLADPAFSVIDDQGAATAVGARAPSTARSTSFARRSPRARPSASGDGGAAADRPERASPASSPAPSAPIPEHIHELLHRGRTADGALAADALGFTPRLSTRAVVQALYEWATVIHLRPSEMAA
jgi:hypothetical protein